MIRARKGAACTAVIAAAALLCGAADAAVMSARTDLDFSTAPVSLDLGPDATFTFTSIPNVPLGDPPAAVSTLNTALVSSILGGVADFGAGASIDQLGELYTFAGFPTPAVIPYSAADDFIGLAFTLADGLHYGYAEVAGTTLIGYAFESTPDTSIVTAPVPEPASIAVFGAGLLGAASLRRRRTIRSG